MRKDLAEVLPFLARCLCGAIINPDRIALHKPIENFVSTAPIMQFGSSLFKGLRIPKAEPWSPSAEGETNPAFLFVSFFFAPPSCKEKAAKDAENVTGFAQKKSKTPLRHGKGAWEGFRV